MGSSTVKMLKPLVGTLDGGATTGSLLPEGVATTIADEVDACPAEEYAGGPVKSGSGAPYPEDELSECDNAG